MIQVIKEMIRLNIKPNFAALGRVYNCDYRTAKTRYYEELDKEKGIIKDYAIPKITAKNFDDFDMKIKVKNKN